MTTYVDMKQSWLCQVDEELNNICMKLDEKISRKEYQLKARRKKCELESKMAQELKVNAELTQRLTELSRRDCDLDRVCANFESCLTIADSDRQRLENAKETYQIAKELTGIRFDFEAPPDVVKGYIKSETFHLLQAFELPSDPDALWALLGEACSPAWPRAHKNRIK